jgi:hypothetical protein
MIRRDRLISQVERSLRLSPVVALLGPRQCGKTTLARLVSAPVEQGGTSGPVHFFDLEDERTFVQFANPLLRLESLRGLIVLDEFQRLPALLPALRVLADRPDVPARFLILGSASPDLIRGASETLAGRVDFVDMAGFTLDEVAAARPDTPSSAVDFRSLWFRGGFPRSFLAPDDDASQRWRQSFIRTFLERDLRLLGVNLPPDTARRFWTMLAHNHGGIWNGSDIGSSLGVTYHTARRYLDQMSGAYVVRSLQPYFENVGKRVVKSPKVYVRDTGLLHELLEIPTMSSLSGNPKIGPSFEGFVVEQLLAQLGERNAYFWATHAGAELDLLLVRAGKKWGVEVKYTDAPSMTKSMRAAFDTLKLEYLWVVHAGQSAYPIAERVQALPVTSLGEIMSRVGAG